MREIKFRAWHTEKKKMFSAEEMAADQITLLPTGKFIKVSGSDTRLSTIIDCMIPLQFTGIYDDDGVEIYEGDIVKHLNLPGRLPQKVEWLPEAYAFDIGVNDFVYDQECGCVDPENIERIGNIYEHPELLEKSK